MRTRAGVCGHGVVTRISDAYNGGRVIGTLGELVGILVAVLAGSFWLVFWRADRTDEARLVVVEMRDFLQGVVARGGGWSSDYMTQERRANENALDDAADEVHNGALRRELRAALDAYRRSFAAAPTSVAGYVSLTPTAEQTAQYRRQDERRARSAEAAHEALDHLASALREIRRLQRFAVRK